MDIQYKGARSPKTASGPVAVTGPECTGLGLFARAADYWPVLIAVQVRVRRRSSSGPTCMSGNRFFFTSGVG